MIATAVAAQVPPGYTAERERGARVVALPSVIETVLCGMREAGTLYAWAAALPDATALRGRGTAWAVTTSHGEWVVRHYRRGGLAARVLGDRYLRLGETRPLSELRASAAARARGVATPEIVAAVAYGAGPVYRADLATVRVAHSADFADTVLGPARRPPVERLAAWQAAGALLRRAFDAGVVHADLNLRNILIQRDSPNPTAYLLDLDRAVVRDAGADDVARQRMLGRLHRSRRKLEAELGSTVTAAELAVFDDAVAGR